MQALRQWLTHPVTVRLAQLAIGALFIVAALAKLGDLPAFAEQIHNFRSLPLAAENLVATTLPWIELVAGLALVFGIRPRSGAWVVGGLTAVFTVAVIVAWVRGLDIECGCFGTADSTRVGLEKLLQNSGMLVLAVVAGLRADRDGRTAATARDRPLRRSA
jgi:uncharacterized membrane protein YphA (DoxX/SURF4 family)